jgi:hypothetical protein
MMYHLRNTIRVKYACFSVRFQVLTAASMMFRVVFWVILPMMEAVRTSETSVDNHFTLQYNPKDNSEHHST